MPSCISSCAPSCSCRCPSSQQEEERVLLSTGEKHPCIKVPGPTCTPWRLSPGLLAKPPKSATPVAHPWRRLRASFEADERTIHVGVLAYRRAGHEAEQLWEEASQ